MRLLLFIFFLFPFCAMAQIEVVNESMICDSFSNVLEIGKFNYLQFKNLPADALITVSEGKITPDSKVKNRYFIPGQKTMEGRSTNLKVTSGGKLVFSKDYQYKYYYEYINTFQSFGTMPIRVGNIKGGNRMTQITCMDSLLQDPLLHPMCEGIKIMHFEIVILHPHEDPIGPIMVRGNNFKHVLIQYLKERGDVKVFIENINIALLGRGFKTLSDVVILEVKRNCNTK